MTAPTPAAVRAAMTELYLRTDADDAALSDDTRDCAEVLRDHIRAIVAEMRREAAAARVNAVDPFTTPAVRDAERVSAQTLERFANKLEGKQ